MKIFQKNKMFFLKNQTKQKNTKKPKKYLKFY